MQVFVLFTEPEAHWLDRSFEFCLLEARLYRFGIIGELLPKVNVTSADRWHKNAGELLPSQRFLPENQPDLC